MSQSRVNLTRRRFLQATTAGGGAAILSSGSTFPAGQSNAEEAPLRAFPKLPFQPTGAKIKSVETFVVSSNLAFVRLRCDDNSEGIGQIAPFDADISATVLHRRVARHVLGHDPANLDALAERAIQENYKFPWSYVCRAYAGIDTALWDLLGRREKKSVAELLGASPANLRVYGSSMRRDISPKDEAERFVKLRDEQGITAFKIRVGKRLGRDQDQSPGRTKELVPTVRKAVGENVDLLADANSCYTPPKAIEVGRMLEDSGYSHFEEPCPYWEMEWTGQVARALRMPVAGGEQDNSLALWRRMVATRAVDIVQPDICYMGGLTRALKVAQLAADVGLTCVPHSANLSMVTLFTLHLFSAIPNAGRHVEFSIESNNWTEDIFAPSLKVVDGKVQTPAGPGWGVRVGKEVLDRAKRQTTEAQE